MPVNILIMNKKALKTLEYNKITEMLSDRAASPMAKEMCLSLEPMGDLDEIRKAQKNTTDALSRILRIGALSFGGVTDVRPSLARLEMGASLSASELLDIGRLLTAAARAKSYGIRDVGEDEYDSLDEMFISLSPLTSLAKEIDRCIISAEEIADDASSGLHSLRRNIAATKSKITAELNSILQRSRTLLQDPIITTRNGRYCLPVKSEHRSSFSGMVHDQSATGSTVFMEPLSVIKLNNELRELEIAEIKEIEKVLAALSASAAAESSTIAEDLKVMTNLDFIFAKASLSRHYSGSEPVFNKEGRINIKKGRHPLISKDKVVPTDIRLGDEFTLLIITGPNTGGKTVSLKTIGLFTIMGQAGLHIPAFDGSQLAVFDEVYADIGDEQSIEQSLSTFSAHMTNIAPIIKNADIDSLCLFDELGAGTDPTEGAALAISILNHLKEQRIRTVATTHYAELKLYALSTDGVENASCEFDIQSLRPTYRLLIGIPGRSNAFAISEKLGIPDYIIEDAKSRITSDETHFEDVISELESGRIQLEDESAKLEKMRRELESKAQSLASREKTLDEKQEKILGKARSDAEKMLAETKAFVDETIRAVNKHTSGSDLARELEKERTKVREKMGKNQSKPAPAAIEKAASIDPKKVTPGTRVRVISMNAAGDVITAPNSKGELTVMLGIMRYNTNLKDIIVLNESSVSFEGKALKSSGGGAIKMGKSLSVSPEINLIGKTTDEAIPLLDKYLDDAHLAGLPSCRIVHGRGTGALRNAVHQHLKKQKYIKAFRLGEYGEGDAGVTVAEFK